VLPRGGDRRASPGGVCRVVHPQHSNASGAIGHLPVAVNACDLELFIVTCYDKKWTR
jgi:exo-beta-1,3-glucanase (GH17 family)